MKIDRGIVATTAAALTAFVATTDLAVAQSAASACDSLRTAAVPTSDIGLPTGGAKAVSTAYMPASGVAPRSVGAFCRVLLDIAPVDPKAPPIKMEVNLPDDWNGKALMYGGGGYNGVILSTGGVIRLQPPEVPIPLGRGYVTFSGNGGHEASAGATFALNDEALSNYAFDAVKKTRDVAVAIIKARYGRPADKIYFHGSSTGGKEALGVIQRYPRDIDGAMIFWPATYNISLSMQFARLSRALEQPGAWPSGVNGADAGDDCLSDAQIKALKVMSTPLKLDYDLASGLSDYPGFYTWGSGLGVSDKDQLSKDVLGQGFGTVPPASPTKPGMPFDYNFADLFIRYFVTKNSDAKVADVDPEHPGKWRKRFVQLSGMMEMSKTDLSAFRRHGGKILLFHGLSDQIVPAQSTVDYYRRVVDTMGQGTVSSFVKYFELPGTGHSGFGVTFNPTWDALGALDDWVTNGVAPKSAAITDTHFKPGRTRPLCEYPAWPRYNGSGDVDQASSFACVRS